MDLYQEALLEPFIVLSVKRSKHSNRAVTINLNTLIFNYHALTTMIILLLIILVIVSAQSRH